MKKILIEYSNVIAYTITGLVFGFSFFLLFLNFYHYRDVNMTYQKQDSDRNVEEDLKIKLNQVKINISGFDINTYKGNEDPTSLASVKSRLDICVKKIDTQEFQNILSKNSINIKDIYEMQQFYQVQISNECLVKQLYEISLPDKLNLSSLKTMAPFLENNINQLLKSTDYVQKVIKNNSSYAFSIETSKIYLYDQTKDSYYTILNSYVSAIDVMYDLSTWYKEVSGGV